MTFHAVSKVVGKVPGEIKYDLYDPNNVLLKTDSKKLTAFMEETLFSDGIFTMCYTNLDGVAKKLNFDIVISPKEGSEEVLEVGDLSMYMSELENIYVSMERVSKLMNAHTEKTNEQVNIRRTGKEGFQWWVYYKTFAIVLI